MVWKLHIIDNILINLLWTKLCLDKPYSSQSHLVDFHYNLSSKNWINYFQIVLQPLLDPEGLSTLHPLSLRESEMLSLEPYSERHLLKEECCTSCQVNTENVSAASCLNVCTREWGPGLQILLYVRIPWTVF